jgi:PTS system nitrogen regulatory IIA component
MTFHTKDIQWDCVLPHIKASSKKAVFQLCAQEAAPMMRFPAILLENRLADQEALSSSAIGGGVALAHLRLAALERPFTVIATLKTPLAFDTPDGKDVDLVAVLLSPEQDGPLHLTRLSRLSRLLLKPGLKSKILEARDPETIRALLLSPDGWMMAA